MGTKRMVSHLELCAMNDAEVLTAIRSACEDGRGIYDFAAADVRFLLGIIDRKQADSAKLQAAIEAVEWVGRPEEASCPWCYADPLEGHAIDCRRQAALGLTEPQ